MASADEIVKESVDKASAVRGRSGNPKSFICVCSMHDRNRGKLSISMHSVQSKKRLKIKSIRGRLGRRDGVDRARLGSRPHWGIYRGYRFTYLPL